MRTLPLIAILAASPALADPGDGYGHMGWGYGAGMMFGPVLWLIVLGLVIAGVIWFARGGAGHAGPSEKPDPLAELDMRLARGEIDPEDYAARRKLLKQSG